MIYNILIFIFLVILIIFYGGENKINKIKYNSERFSYYKNINIFRKKLLKYKKIIDEDYIDITNNINTCNYLLPNIVYSYCIKIQPKTIFDIKYLIKNDKYKDNYEMLMNIYTLDDDIQNLYLVINNENNEYTMVHIDENIYITNTYNIYNDNNNKDIILILFFIKKPFWY
jgi:hypothetical protein